MIENEAIQRKQDEKINKGKIEIALTSPPTNIIKTTNVQSKTDHLGVGLYNS